jgi:tetrahydromethanopterin S-methyltransferase subunit H
MFSFTKEQKVFEISGIKIGGQPGIHPTILFGGIFFNSNLDFESVEKNLQKVINISNKTSNPVIPDFFIKKEEHIENIINFIDKKIPDNLPFSIDIIEPSIKVKVLENLNDRNLLSRTIYNSINIGITDDEINSIKEYTPEMAIILAFNPKDKSPDGKVEVLENGANLTEDGLLSITKNLGIKKIIVDTAALAPGDNSGAAIAAIPVIKEEYGLPTGCAIHNVVEKSKWLDNFDYAKKTVDICSNVNISLFGGDYVIFGPMKNAEYVIPVIAWEDILISEYVENYFGISPDDFHPRRNLL